MLKYLFKLFILLIVLLSAIFLKLLLNYSRSIKEIELIDEYINETKEEVLIDKKDTTTTKVKTNNSSYLMVLEIPKVGIKKGIYNKDNQLNNVDNNIAILNSSSLPDEDKGSVILASHNGNSKVSFFKRLEELEIDDVVNIYYLGIKYTYKIYKYDIVDKVGNIQVTKDRTVSNVVLISCKNGTNDKQIVFIGRLVSTNKY